MLVGVALKRESRLLKSSLAELKRLAETAGVQVAGEFSQAVSRFAPGSLIGRGKIEELSRAVPALKARTVIFDAELSPAQQKTLETALQAKIIDRTRLILDIFAKRARTSEGRLQVELAQLSYMLPRLTGAWRAFSQQVGGIGTRGPGERQLEYERRHIQRRMRHLEGELARVKAGRDLRRQRRLAVPVPQAALVGYTNVGKSTLLNALTGSAAAYADDKLFATLDPTSRRVKLPEGSWAVFTDTVGFIQRLPTTLIAAFRATLEEVRAADCLILVSDASDPDREEQEKSVAAVLTELGAERVPRIVVLNKADRLSAHRRAKLKRQRPDAVLVSATQGEGISEMLALLQEKLGERWVLRELDLPYEKRALAAEVYASAQVLSETHAPGRLRLRLRVTSENWQRLRARLGLC